MDPKVCGKLLTTHGEGDDDDDDDEGLRDGSPSGGAPEQAPRWDLHENRRYGGAIRGFSLFMEFLGYIDLYRKKEGTGGRSRGPRGRGRALGRGRAPHPRGPPLVHLTWFSSSACVIFSKKYLSRRCHSVWTPFDILFLQNPETGKNSNLDWAFGFVG